MTTSEREYIVIPSAEPPPPGKPVQKLEAVTTRMKHCLRDAESALAEIQEAQRDRRRAEEAEKQAAKADRTLLPSGWQMEHIGLKDDRGRTVVLRVVFTTPGRVWPGMWSEWFRSEILFPKMARPCPYCGKTLADRTSKLRLALLCVCGFLMEAREVRQVKPSIILED